MSTAQEAKDPMSRLAKRWKRRTLVMLDRRMQLHFLIVWLVASLAIVGTLAAFAAWALSTGRAPTDPAMRGALFRFLAVNGAIFLLFAAAMGLYGVLRMHKIAGAVFNIRRVLGQSAEGDLAARVQLRKGDDLQELALDINHLLDLRAGEMRDLSRAAEIASSLRGVIELEKNSSEDVRKLAARLTRTIEGVEEE